VPDYRPRCIGLAPAPVEGKHEEGGGLLVERVGGSEFGQFEDELVMVPESQLGGQALNQRDMEFLPARFRGSCPPTARSIRRVTVRRLAARQLRLPVAAGFRGTERACAPVTAGSGTGGWQSGRERMWRGSGLRRWAASGLLRAHRGSGNGAAG
jgi:hypothetical protein